MNFAVEPLSLGTFEPAHAQPPYLNTPRSLEACRLHGINPVELVEVSIDEFRKDFPDDPDRSQRRFERIDGARRRMMTTVMTEWKHLCDTNWKPRAARPKSAKERILDVPAEAHSTLLEIQAARFRKIETDEWNAFQRMLAMSVKKADMEVKNRATLEKHAEIQKSNDDAKKKMQLRREQLFLEHMEAKKRAEEEQMQEIKRLQAQDAEEAMRKIKETEERLRKEKQGRERRERERLQREEYTKQLKESIMKNLEKKADTRKQLQDMRAKDSEDRVREAREAREAEQAERRREQMDRQQKARADLTLSSEEQRAEMLKRIEEDEAKRQRIRAQRERARLAQLEEHNDNMKEKMMKCKESTHDGANGRASKALSDIQFKEALAKQELDKVREAQERRRGIKSIRQEAYDIAAMRKKKADEYRMRLAQQAIKNKNDKCEAIQNGFLTLSQMRNKMKDIMLRATTEVKQEMQRLQHRDEFSPERVMNSAMSISQQALFPKLKKTFGMVEPVSESQKKHIEATIGGYNDGMTSSASPAATRSRATTAPHLSRSLNDVSSDSFDKQQQQQHQNIGRGEFVKTLPIQMLNKERLAESLLKTKARMDLEEESKPIRGTSGVPGSRTSSPNSAQHKKSSSPSSSPQQEARIVGGGGSISFKDEERGNDSEAYSSSPTNTTPAAVAPRSSSKRGTNKQKGTKKGTLSDRVDGASANFPYGEVMDDSTRSLTQSMSKSQIPESSKMSMRSMASSPQHASATIERLSLAAQVKVVDPHRQLEALRREQNEALMRVLEEERGAEEARERMTRSVMTEQESSRLELLFAEERKRASERIVKLTKEHEQRVKDAVLAMAMGRSTQ